ncbi:MAG: oligosaccharide flippase family protein, partial [Candidatus Aminicenantes bacterium]|nr:oligosaccharide flippase family protein [Candidatus Aminicenantes bacterium]
MPPPDLDDSDAGVSALKDQAVTGMLWNFGGHFLRVFLQFAFGVLLARLLAPEAFGLLAMVMVFSGFAQLFCELGLAAAIIQKRDLDERHLSSIFWFNLGAGGILTLAFVLLAPALASFYRQPRLAPLVAAVSPVFVFSALVIVQHSLLTRRLAFKKLFFAESAAVLVSGAVAVLLALHGFGVWSLVCQTLLMAALQGAFLWFQGRW